MFILKEHNINIVNDTIPNNPNRFPDGTLALGSISDCYDTILWLYDNDAEIFTLQCLRQHTHYHDVTLIMPYIPHARMDRTELGEVFTLKTFCSIINSMNFKKVIVADPHSNVSIALIDRVEVIQPAKYIHMALTAAQRDAKYPNLADFIADKIFFFPDDGAMKRYSKMFPGMPYAYGNKDRDWATGRINGVTIINKELVKDKPVFIVDDICSKGGTFHYASKALKEAGAGDIYLYVTHCESTVFDGDMYKEDLVKKIFTTDTLNRDLDPKIEVVYSFAEDFTNGKIF